MPVIPFIPLIASGVGAIAGKFGAKKAQDAAQKRSPEEAVAQTGAQTGAQTLQTGGAEALKTGEETQQPATNYFDTLLHGNRAQQSQAVAAPTAKITDVYAGAQRNLEQQGVRGAQKDVASAGLNQGRASQISSLVTGVQPAAANALTSIGQTQQQRGAGMIGSSNATNAGLLQQGNANRQYARGEGEKAGSSIGGLVFDVANAGAQAYGAKSGASGLPPIPARQTTQGSTTWMPGG